MDVPTFVHGNSGDPNGVTPAPYLCRETGELFSTPGELSKLLEDLESGKRVYSPRAWMMRHGSDGAAAWGLLKAAGCMDDPSMGERRNASP